MLNPFLEDKVEKIEIEVEPAKRGKGEIVFVVEDNADIRRNAIYQLKSLGYKTVEAPNGHRAIELIDSDVKFDFLFSDVIMPGAFSGLDVARKTRAKYPDMPILLTSGFPGTVIEEIQKIMPAVQLELLGKPYRKADLARKIREALDKKSRELEGVFLRFS